MVILRVLARSELVTIKTHKKIMEEVHRGVMEHHLIDSMPLRFRAGAENVFHFKRRTRAYQKRKLRVKGHNKTLVWSGQTEQDIRQLKTAIIANSNRARVQYTMHFQKVQNRRKASTLREGSNLAERVTELEKILQREIDSYGVDRKSVV